MPQEPGRILPLRWSSRQADADNLIEICSRTIRLREALLLLAHACPLASPHEYNATVDREWRSHPSLLGLVRHLRAYAYAVCEQGANEPTSP